MIITLGSAALFIGGCIALWLVNQCIDRYTDNSSLFRRIMYRHSDGIFATSVGLIIISAGVLITCIITLICVQTTYYEKESELSTKKQMIELKLQNNICGMERCSIDEVLEFNLEIVTEREALKNPWINWFVSQAVANAEEIDISKYDLSNHGSHTQKVIVQSE